MSEQNSKQRRQPDTGSQVPGLVKFSVTVSEGVWRVLREIAREEERPLSVTAARFLRIAAQNYRFVDPGVQEAMDELMGEVRLASGVPKRKPESVPEPEPEEKKSQEKKPTS